MEKAGKQKEKAGRKKTESSSSISTDGNWVGVDGPGSRRDPGLYIVVCSVPRTICYTHTPGCTCV